eukprot:COSAG06_NODE_32516_length_504_cov_2.390123_1_plen_32_part_10
MQRMRWVETGLPEGEEEEEEEADSSEKTHIML